ncbi:esterase [Archangium minus]|uniref:Esterase n=1 Tax=Archangium minus TaxID=83450 RepID=A0ABY9X4Y6_9BACT|nr:esterase [Archangium minus]
MNPSRIELGELAVDFAREGGVPYAVLLPPGYDSGGPYPLVLFLYGGGGSRQTLVEARSVFEQCWSMGSAPPVVLACATVGEFSYYLDHPDGRYRWERFLSEDFPRHLRATYKVRPDRASTALLGISMGGYGSLKIAFQHPETFGAVAALQPITEPGFRATDAGERNHLYFIGGGPEELVGPKRNPALFEANNPAVRARDNARAILEHGLAIYLEAGDADALNAHDVAEFIHRVLWDLDISHEYHLVRGADHVGPSVVPRLREAFVWLGAALRRAEEGEAPEDAAIRGLRTHLEGARAAASEQDPTTLRRFGVLPPSR